MNLRQIFCWHQWKRSKHQFQALSRDDGSWSLSLECRKCGKTRVVIVDKPMRIKIYED